MFMFSVFGSSIIEPDDALILAVSATKSLKFTTVADDNSASKISVSPQMFNTAADDASMSNFLQSMPRFMTEADAASISKSLLLMRFESLEMTLALPISILLISEQ